MSYNNAYQNTPNLWGDKPTNLIVFFEDKFEPGCNCLDLGCDQGRDAIYMAKNNFKVIAVDNSEVAIEQLSQKIKEENISNIEAICSDILLLEIIAGKFQIIIAINALQFLPREQCLKFIYSMKEKIAANGFIIIKSFTVNDSGFVKTRNNNTNTFFQSNELKELFSDFNIIHYFEYLTLDPGHGEKLEPHLHGIVELVAQKK